MPHCPTLWSLWHPLPYQCSAAQGSSLLSFQALATGELQASEAPSCRFLAVCPACEDAGDACRWQGSALSHTPQYHVLWEYSLKAPEAAVGEGIPSSLGKPVFNYLWVEIAALPCSPPLFSWLPDKNVKNVVLCCGPETRSGC